MDVKKLLDELVERLKKAHGASLESVVLYGSAAVGDIQDRFSDLNVLCILTRVTPRELEASEPIFEWWRAKDNPAPLLMSVEEAARSADCFPMEFHDIQERSKLLYGRDLVHDVSIDDRYYRAQVEHELRAKLLRLRQKAAGMMHDDAMLLRLMSDSVSTFCVVLRHAMALDGAPRPATKRESVEAARERFAMDATPFVQLLDLREEKIKARDLRAVELLGRYMASIETAIARVDRLGRS